MSGKPVASAKAHRLGLVPDQRVPGAGQAVRPQNVLHAGLVAEVARRPRAHPLDSEGVSQFAERYLQLLERAQQPVDPAEFAGEPAQPDVDALRRQRVVDPGVRRDPPPQRGGHSFERFLRHDPEPHAGEPRSGFQKTQRGRGDRTGRQMRRWAWIFRVAATDRMAAAGRAGVRAQGLYYVGPSK